MALELEKKMCESNMCTEKATTLEPYKGQLYSLCNKHARLAIKQKKADNNDR